MNHPVFRFWAQSYGLVPPLNWKLRGGLPERWLRIHTLPNSKRYAGNDSEAAEIAARQVTTAKALFEDDAPVWLVTWRYRLPSGATEFSEPTGREGIPFEEAGAIVDDAEDETIAVLVARLQWSASTSAGLCRAIADGEDPAMWVHERTAEVFAPYDGGVDLIFSSVERRDTCGWEFAAWLSARPDGL